MTYDKKKEHILRCVKLGMELFRAEIAAGCTERDIAIIEKDVRFNKVVEQYYALEEYNLLIKHKTAMDVAAASGRAVAIQWKLERINSDRWGSSDEEDAPILPDLTVNLIGVAVKKKVKSGS